MREYDLAGKVIGLAMKVHSALGPGFLESVYQNALAFELRKTDWVVETEKDLCVIYEGESVGRFTADLVVDEALVIENKAVSGLLPAHEVQLVNYLTCTGIESGLLLNFGPSKLEFMRKYNDRHPLYLSPNR